MRAILPGANERSIALDEPVALEWTRCFTRELPVDAIGVLGCKITALISLVVVALSALDVCAEQE